jgi:hypothetical protein
MIWYDLLFICTEQLVKQYAFLKKEILFKFGVNPVERTNHLLDESSFLKVKKGNLSKEAMVEQGS